MIQSFVANCCTCAPGALAPAKAIVRAFRESYPDQKSRWPRGRILSALASAGHPTVIERGLTHVAGLALNEAIQVVDGQVQRAA